MAIFMSKCLECGREFENSHVQNLTHCSVGCQYVSINDEDDGLVIDGELPEYDLCPNCCTPWKCNGPHLTEGADVTLFGKPGTVRWVLPGGRGVAVVFEDGQMFWAYSEHIGQIEDRD